MVHHPYGDVVRTSGYARIPEGGHAVTFFVKGQHGKMGSFFMDKGKPVKDLKFWLRRGVTRDKIGAMIKLKSPEEIKNDK